MRWNVIKPIPPSLGERRVRRVFAWKPIRVEGHMVWLETYEIHEQYSAPGNWGPDWWQITDTKLYDPIYY